LQIIVAKICPLGHRIKCFSTYDVIRKVYYLNFVFSIVSTKLHFLHQNQRWLVQILQQEGYN
jgi:hypothetical protein